MKQNIFTLLLMVFAMSATAQNLSLAELQNLCKQSNWENGANILTRKGWEYHNSKRGDTYEYSTISYAYGKDAWYDDRATAWFRFYTYNGRVEEIDYQPTDNAYKAIKNSLAANGYKLTDSKIYDNSIASFYSSPSFILVIQTSTQERAYSGGTMVSYIITLTRKGGIYDNDNGEKVDYYYGTSNIKERYTLKDGKRHGKCYSYFEDGTLQSVITYTNGIGNGSYIFYNENGKPRISGTLLNDEKNGLITEYDEYGDKNFEYTAKNGKANGKFTAYHYNGKIRATGNYVNGEKDGLITEFDTDGRKINECYYKDGEKNGQYKEYTYNEDGELGITVTGSFVDNERDGYWETKVLKDGKWYTALYSNYNNGTLHGAAKEWKAGCDSIVYCNYQYGKLHGEYREKRQFLGAGFLFDDENLYTDVEGQYYNGNKNGHWTYRNKLMQIEMEGNFLNDKEEGEWKYYFANQILESIANYYNGKLNGKFVQIKKDFINNKLLDPSFDYMKQEIRDSIDFICHYENGELNGHYEKHDNDGNIISEGNYSNNKRYGRWIDIDTTEDAKYCWNYKNGKPDGLCEEFAYSSGRKLYTNNFTDGVLDGRQYWYNIDGSTFLENNFKNGVMQSQIMYNDDKTKQYEFQLIEKRSYNFTGKVTLFYSHQYNPDISKITTEYYYNIHPDSLLKRILPLSLSKYKPQSHGIYQVFDHQNRIIVDGQNYNGRNNGNWTFRFYNQNVYYIENKDDTNKPWLFYTIDTDQPFSGKFTRTENKNGRDLTATYKIKKSLIEEIIYVEPTTDKTVFKEKYKDGLLIKK